MLGKENVGQLNHEKTATVSLNKLVVNFLGTVIRNGGTVATEEHAKKRLEICRGCEFYGEVNPLPLIKAKGCLQCGCPLATKVKCIENLDIDSKKMVVTRCGNAEKGGVDFWKDVDSKFNYDN